MGKRAIVNVLSRSSDDRESTGLAKPVDKKSMLKRSPREEDNPAISSLGYPWVSALVDPFPETL